MRGPRTKHTAASCRNRDGLRRGLGQLTLVEHALCPLASRCSLGIPLVHETRHFYSDKKRRRRKANVRVCCPEGLAPFDEFLLLGLLAIVMRDKSAGNELHATPHYCLRQLGLIDPRSRRGGRQYQQFSAGLKRLSLVSYQNDAFYDPVRAEHRKVAFGFVSYSLPIDPQSSRAWRIVFDPLLFEYVGASAGHLWFDLELYRFLDAASRRMFLLVSKGFGRRKPAGSLRFELRHLAIDVLGFSPTVATWDLKIKLQRVLIRLAALDVIASGNWIDKRGPGNYKVIVARGKHFDRPLSAKQRSQLSDAPLYEPLRALGFDERGIGWLLRSYRIAPLREWTDITLAAQERFGASFFQKSPQAYLVDNLKAVGKGERTPPDWWHEVRKEEECRVANRHREQRTSEGPTSVAEVLNDVFRARTDSEPI